ncbi:MAG: hypothetical protein Q4P05_06795 [Actinomycetaceae bacterium]|nr:hypothetical protein [Actinomycetaceae bacterium]
MYTLYNLISAFFRRDQLTADQRGDVPGWVLVTLMTAGLVTVIWAVASDRLVNLFEQAMNTVVP